MKMITADVYDLQYYPNLKEKYNIMSVPCLIINDDEVHFGRKAMSDLLIFSGIRTGKDFCYKKIKPPYVRSEI